MADGLDERRELADRLARFYASFVEVRDAAIDSEGATAWDIFADACEANLPTILAALREPSGYRAGAEAMREAAVRAITEQPLNVTSHRMFDGPTAIAAPDGCLDFISGTEVRRGVEALGARVRALPIDDLEKVGRALTPEAGQAEGGDHA